MRVLALLLLAAGALSACAAPPPAAPPAQQFSQRQLPPAPEATPPPAHIRANGTVMDLADYMYGPPPRTKVDARVRCRVDCPNYPPGSLLLLH